MSDQPMCCVCCGKEMQPNDGDFFVCCGEVNHVETVEESERRWNELAMPEEMDAYLENLAERNHER